jgi:hypothetical protein
MKLKLKRKRVITYTEKEVYDLCLLKDQEFWQGEHNSPFDEENEKNSKEWFEQVKKK